MKRVDPEELSQALLQFCGSVVFYEHALDKRARYTEGVQYLAHTAGAYWLIDAIVSHQLTPRVRAEEFQAWTLHHNDDDSWTLSATDGNDKHIAVQQIEFSDFPLQHIALWFVNWTLMLPGEY